jgi:hypothetical protein
MPARLAASRVMSLGRRLFFILWLARRRLARRLGPSALVGLGIAAGALVLAGVSAGSVLVQDRSLEREAARLPEADRAVRALWFGVPRETGWSKLDREASRALAGLERGPPARVLLYRRTNLGRDPVDLGAADGLSRWVRLRSGRLPRRCRPDRCEVVQLGGSGAVPSVRGLRLVRVGEGTLISALPFGTLVSREEDVSVVGTALRYHTPASPPFLLAEGVEALGEADPLTSVYRSYGWVVPLRPGSVRPWEVDELSAAITGARSTLEATTGVFDVNAPTQALETARERAQVGGRRLQLVGGEAAALLLAFAVLAASALRRDTETAARRLTWFGARRWQLVALPGAEAAAVAMAAAAVGWAGGGLLVGLAARRAGVGAVTILRESVLSREGLATALLLAVLAWLVVLGFLRARPIRLGGASFTPLDAGALGALGVIVFALARSDLDAEDLASETGSGTLLLVLPALVAFVAAVAAARALGPTLRLAERVGRRGPLSVRLAALALARNPGRAAVAVSFLAVSFGLALFADAYRSTLARGQEDQAAFAVPADFILREDLRNLVPVTDVGSIGGAEVLRRSGDVTRLEGSDGVTLLGLPNAALAGIDGWREDFAPQSFGELGRRIAARDDPRLRVVPLPADATELRLQASLTGDDVTIAASVETPRGDFVTVPLGQTRGPQPVELHARLPDEARGGGLVALTFGIAREIHHDRGEGEAVREPPATANLTLGPLRADGLPLPLDYARWLAGDGAHLVEGAPGGARLALILTDEFPGRFRPRQPTDGRSVPALVSPRLAAAASPGGILPVRLAQDQLRVRVVGVAERFPSVAGDFVVADRELAATALNADRPGAAVSNEVWLEVREDRRAAVAQLKAPPFSVLDVQSQEALLADLRGNPLARGTLLTLVGAAAIALALALVGLLLVIVTGLRDDAGELLDLESQGLEPRALRHQLRLRTGSVAAFGLLGGLVAGLALAVLVVDFVSLTAGAAAAEPPLVLALDWPVLGLAALGYAISAAVLVTFATGRSFRRDEAGRARETLA